MELIRYLSLLILVALASCTTNATVAVQVGAGSCGVVTDAEVEKTSAVPAEEITPKRPCDETIRTNPVEEQVSPSVVEEKSPNTAVAIGDYLDPSQQKAMQGNPRILQRMERGDPLTVADVIKLHQCGVSDDAIFRYLQDRNTIYQLNETQAKRLHDAGVGERVIDYMTRIRQ